MNDKRPNESAIRDFLAERLELAEPGLTLVDREHYLSSARGAAGFLDLFAHDSAGRLVVIEIKRTDGAAREAIQELYKYAALLRERYLVREVEYRFILLSVEWHELLVPYSEFVKTVPFEISAGRIVLDEKGWPARVDPISPTPTAGQRRFSRRHFLWRFKDDAKAAAAIPLIAAHMRKGGLEDYVLVRSHSNNPQISDKTFVYFAHQELTLAEYCDRIRRQLSDDLFEEFEEQISDLTEEEDKIGEAADAVWLPEYDDLYERMHPEHSEISHPEKATHWFADGAQRDIVIDRFGKFADPNLPDETILSEIIGQGGVSDYLLKLGASTASKPQMSALRKAIENVFFFNSEWRSASLDLVSYAEKTGPALVKITAFSNEDVLRSIAGAAFNYLGYIPTFRLEIERANGEVETFMGLPEWNGTTFDFNALVKAHFEDDPFYYFTACHFGENRGINADLMSDLGLRYIVFRMAGDTPERVRIVGSSIVGSPRQIRGSVFGLIEANMEEVEKIVAMFMQHDLGFSKTIEAFLNDDLDTAERELEKLREVRESAKPIYWSEIVDRCDVCKRDMASARFMVDGPIGPGLPWACMCALCFSRGGGRVSYGSGQLYEKDGTGWRLVGGANPD